MMKKSYFLMLMALAFLLQGCSTENMNDEAASIGSTNKFQLSSKRISLAESKHKLQLLPEISEAKTMLKSMKSNASGKVIDYGNGTSIDTNDVIYIENGPNYHTYTFNIIRENAPANAPVENLVLSPLSDGTYREILVSYYITDQEKEILRSGGTVDTKNKITYQSLETGSFQSGITSKTQDCHLEINFYYTECSENLHSHGEQYPKCKADQPSELVYVITEVCTDTSGGSDNPWDPNFPDLPGGGGGGEGGESTTPCNGNGVLTGPQTPVSGIGYDSGDGCTGVPTMPNLGGFHIKIDTSLNGSKTQCILNKISGDTNQSDNVITLPLNSLNDNFVQKMLRNFNGVTTPNISFHISPSLPNNNWGDTTGSTTNNFDIFINSNVENGSNLMKIVTISHELIHAYMFYSLHSAGVITFDSAGNPVATVSCYPTINYNGLVNFNNLTTAERFLVLFCLMNQNGTLSQQWSHEIFNTPSINASIYRQELENYLLNSYDWDNENSLFKTEGINIFGNNWKQELSKAISWIGLEQTEGYASYINNYSTAPSKFNYINLIRSKIQNANSNCQ